VLPALKAPVDISPWFSLHFWARAERCAKKACGLKNRGSTVEKHFFNPSNIHQPRGYTHAVAVEGGRTIFIAGQVAFDYQGNLVGKGDLRAQAEKALENLVAALAAAGATPADVVKMNTYVVNYQPANLPVIRETRSRIFPGDKPPASTLIGVQALAMDGLLIEIEAIAVLK
jgi:enamine deaminase RidA (YjgF/YER057c/UK114 family)